MIVFHPGAKLVPIELDHERNLLFDFNALAICEEALGRPALSKGVASKVGPQELRVMLWAALLHEDKKVRWDQFGRMVDAPELSLGDVGVLIQAKRDNEYILAKLLESFIANRPEPKASDEVDPRKANPQKSRS